MIVHGATVSPATVPRSTAARTRPSSRRGSRRSKAERQATARVLAAARPATLTPGDVRDLIESLGDLRPVLADADPQYKADVYADLGIALTYRPAERLVNVEAAPRMLKDVSEGRLAA
jgi:hypothetical protein